MPPEPTEIDGGWGNPARRADTNLAARAIRQGWDVPAEKRPAVVERLLTVVERAPTPENDREAISAAKALMYADKIDLDARKADAQSVGNADAAAMNAVLVRLVAGLLKFVPPADHGRLLAEVDLQLEGPTG